MSAGRVKFAGIFLLALTWAVAAEAQVQEVKNFQRDMQLKKERNLLLASFGFPEVFSARMQKRLSSGFTSHILLGVHLLAGEDRVPVAQGVIEFTILYDIWEERFSVRKQGPDGLRHLVLHSLTDLIEACGKVKDLALTPLANPPTNTKFILEVHIQVNPTSPELLSNVREYLANPDGRGQAGGTKFFGSFSRVFVNEKDFQGDAVYTYRSPEFALPAN